MLSAAILAGMDHGGNSHLPILLHAIKMSLADSFKYLETSTNALEKQLESTAHDIDGEFNDKWFVYKLDLDKLLVNVDQLRSRLMESDNSESQLAVQKHRLRALSSKINELNFQVKRQKEREEEEIRRLIAENQPPSAIQSQLKHRKSNINLSMEDKLSIDRNTQDSISSDLLAMVSTIKQNAMKFNEKMTADEDVLRNTSEALHQTSSNMDKVGSRLSKYRSSTAIGWWFYIFSVLFLIIAIIAGMIIIRIFPKW